MINFETNIFFNCNSYSSLDFVKFKAGLDEFGSVRSHVKNSCSGVFIFWDNSLKNVQWGLHIVYYKTIRSIIFFLIL